jgi:DnaJ-domain-containing protein 1
MEPNYYVTTLTNAAIKLGPPLLFIVCGYFIFIKLPFLFLKKNMSDQKKKLQEDNKDLQVVAEKKYTVDDYKEFQRKMKLMSPEAEKSKVHALPQEPLKHKRPEPKTEQKAEQKTEQKKKEEPKKYTQPPSQGQSPEEVLGFKTNESFTKSELKKHYFDKLKENHPDRVASMGEDFKKLAEKNTKEINKAYDKLKNSAA